LGGSTLHYDVTIYDGLAGTYLGQHLLSVARERKRERKRERAMKREGVLLFPEDYIIMDQTNHSDEKSLVSR